MITEALNGAVAAAWAGAVVSLGGVVLSWRWSHMANDAANKANDIHDEAVGEMKKTREAGEQRRIDDRQAGLRTIVGELTGNDRLRDGARRVLLNESYKHMHYVADAGAADITYEAIQQAFAAIQENNNVFTDLSRNDSHKKKAWDDAREAVIHALKYMAEDPVFANAGVNEHKPGGVPPGGY